LVLGCADKSVNLLDLRKMENKLIRRELTEGIMDLQMVNDLLICGLRDGNMIVMDSDSMEILYGFGAMK